MSDINSEADELAAVFARMSGLLLSHETLSNGLQLVTSLARETLPGALGSGVTLLDSTGKRITAQATDAIVEQADALQYELEEGPCLSAWASGTLVRVDDLAAEQRWPAWTAAASGLGMAAVLSAPLLVGDEAFGALKVYADRPGVFGDHEQTVLSMFAQWAAVLVANMYMYDSTRRLSENLQAALRTRDTVAIAKGILIGRDGADEATALATLAALAAQRHSTLLEAATATVQSALRRPGL